MSAMECCPGCGLNLAQTDGPTHDYMLSSAECFRLYGENLAREYSDLRYWKVHRLTVDTYAVQHPGDDDPRARQSVSVHLVSLYLALVREKSEEVCVAALRRLSNRPKGSYPFLAPPPQSYEITVANVYDARSPASYQEMVRSWAWVTWNAWSGHHEFVQSLADTIWQQ